MSLKTRSFQVTLSYSPFHVLHLNDASKSSFSQSGQNLICNWQSKEKREKAEREKKNLVNNLIKFPTKKYLKVNGKVFSHKNLKWTQIEFVFQLYFRRLFRFFRIRCCHENVKKKNWRFSWAFNLKSRFWRGDWVYENVKDSKIRVSKLKISPEKRKLLK